MESRLNLTQEIEKAKTCHNALEDMYGRSPYEVTKVESFEMDCLLNSLKSPAHHALYTIHHALHKCCHAEEALLHNYDLVKANYSFILKDDINTYNELKEQILLTKKQIASFGINDSLLVPMAYFNTIKQGQAKIIPEVGYRVLDKNRAITTKKILQRLISATTKCKSQTPSTIICILKELYNHLWISLGTDIRDGTADMALKLSMIPLRNQQEATMMNDIMDVLTHIAALEISRKSRKISRRSGEILMIVEKLAAAGCEGRYMEEALHAAIVALPKSQNYDRIQDDTLDGLTNLNMWSSRSLLWLWRKGHVFHKVSQKDLKVALSIEELCRNPPEFDDPSLPLVLDIGCGLGVTLLGLVSNNRILEEKFELDLDWSKYNYLGSDLSLTAIQWATALTLRRGCSSRIKFLHVSTNTLLQYLEKTNISVKLVLLQFPTPYRLQDEISPKEEQSENETEGHGCNEKLPLSPSDPEFMANPIVLRKMTTILNSDQLGYDKERYLLLQSNCEDVALHLYDSLLDLDMTAVEVKNPRFMFDEQTLSSRTKSWLKIQQRLHADDNNVRRALGSHWADKPLIPIRTETEVSSEFQNTTVHRCLFKR